MDDATLCFVVDSNRPQRVLLGMKKRGFGQGKYNGFGGKIENGERIEVAAIRELEEESSIRVLEADLQQVARLTFSFPYKVEWNQVVHVFVIRVWQGEPCESEEMRPEWFRANALPFNQMWADDEHWLPLVLDGQRIDGRFTFKADNETVDVVELRPLHI